MRKSLSAISFLALVVWLLFAATPRYQTGTWVLNETPAQNTTTGVLTLAATPRQGVALYVNGIRQKPGAAPAGDYTIAGATITPTAETIDLYRDPAAFLVADYLK